MFDYTTSAVEVIIKDAKRLLTIVTIVSSIVLGSYYVYASIAGYGKLYFTIPLASISLSYAIFLIITHRIGIEKAKKAVAMSVRYTRLAMNAVSLGFTIYEIYLAATNVKAINIIFATISVIFFMLMVFLNVTILLLAPRARLISAAIMKDMQDDVFVYINKINAIKGDEKINFDLTPFEKELSVLEPMVQEKQAKRKKTRKETWDRRLPWRRWFSRKKDKSESEDKGE